MSNLSVQHYLGIYETRLSMIERGITHPAPSVVAGVKRLVSALRQLDPREGIRLEATKDYYAYFRTDTGELIAQIDLE